MCVCVCLVKQGGLWRSYDSGSVGSSRGSSAAETDRKGGEKHAWKYHHIVMHHWFPIHHKPVRPVPSSPSPPIQEPTLTRCVCVSVCEWFYLGIPGGSAGGTRAGLEGKWAPSPVWAWPDPGRDGTGGAPHAIGVLSGGAGQGTLIPGGRMAGGAAAVGGGLKSRENSVVFDFYN